MRKIFDAICLIMVLSLSFVVSSSSSSGFGYNMLDSGVGLQSGINYSKINVNHSSTSDYATMAGDSQLFGGYSPFNFIDGYTRGLGLICFLSGGSDCMMSGSIEANNNNINNVNNIDVNNIDVNNIDVNNNVTIGDRLRVQGSVEILDRLVVGLNLNETSSAISPGDAVFEGSVVSNDTIASFPKKFSPGFITFQNGDNDESKNPIYPTSSGFIDSDSKTFCDTDNSPFVSTDRGNLLVTVVTSPFSGSTIFMEITNVVNSSCVLLSFAVFGGDIVPDISVFFYAVSPRPVLATFDGGSVVSNLGNNEDASFKINALNASGQGKLQINTVSNSNNVNAMSIASDQKDSYGLSNIDSIIFSSNPDGNILMTNSIFSASLSGQVGGEYTGSRYSLLNSGTNITTTAIEISSEYNNLILSTRKRVLSSGAYDNGITISDITSDLNNDITTTNIFTEDNGTLYIGNSKNFTKASFSLFSDSSDNINTEFYYCNSGGTYSPLLASDSTGGFTSSGSITFINPLDRGVCNTNIESEAMPNSSLFTYIAIRRTANLVTIPPVISESIILSDSSRYIIGNDGFVGADTALGFINEEFQDEGSITHYFESRNGNGEPLIKVVAVSGKNHSSGILGNSWGLVPEYMGIENFSTDSKVNLTSATNYITLCYMFGVDCSFSADTRGNAIDLIPGGPLLWTMGDAEIWQSLKVHMGSSIDGPAVFNLEGNDVDFNNGSVHISKEVTFQQGFIEGEEVIKFIEQFSSNLGIFTNLQSDIGNWVSVLNPSLCYDGQCAKSDGSGSGYVEMQTNISTLDINETQLSFVYSLSNLIGLGEFSIVVNNNIGSGDIEIFSDTTDNVINSIESISLPESMSNQTLVSISVICNVGGASKPTRQCYFDTAKFNGTSIRDTTINVSSFDSELCGGDGSRDIEGNCNVGIRWDAETAQWIFKGTINASGTVTGGISGTGTANNIPKWNSPTSLTNSQIVDNGTFITFGLPTFMQGNTIGTGYNATYDNLIANNGLIIESLSGIDNAYSCIDSSGGLYRSTDTCNPINLSSSNSSIDSSLYVPYNNANKTIDINSQDLYTSGNIQKDSTATTTMRFDNNMIIIEFD